MLAVLLVAFGYFVGAKIGVALAFQPHTVFTLWPPNSILMAAFLLMPVNRWWLLLLAALSAHLAAQLQSNVPPLLIVSWFISNSSEALIGAALIRRFLDAKPRFDRMRDVTIFLFCGVLLASLLSSFMDAGIVALSRSGGSSYWQTWRLRLFSNVLATLIFVPVIVTAASRGITLLRRVSFGRIAEAVVLWLGLLAVGIAIFMRQEVGPNTNPALLYTPLPLLLWAATRFGSGGISVALLTITFMAIWGAIHDFGPFASRSAADNAFAVQLFLVVVSVPLLCLAAVLQELKRAEKTAHQNEKKLRLALETAQKAERETREQHHQLVHLTRVAMLGELSWALAHELNQPLAAILTNAQAAQRFLAQKSFDRDSLHEILADIVEDDKRAAQIIYRLRPLLRKDEAQIKLVDFNEVVREVLALVHGDLITRNVDLRLVSSDEALMVRGDRVQLQQVLLNLIMNACEAVSGNGPGARLLRIETGRLPGAVHLSIADSGPGIPQDRLNRLFEAFFTTKSQGLGLGLSISRSIVDAHGGSLWAENNPSGGAVFHITLPTRAKSMAARRATH